MTMFAFDPGTASIISSQGVNLASVVPTGTGSWSILIEVPIKVVSEANRRDHWTTRRKRFALQRELVRSAWNASPWAAWRFAGHPRLLITMTRIGRKCDSDNLAGAFKAVRDEVAALIGIDDGDERIEWQYRQRPGNPGGIEIALCPWPSAPPRR